MAKYHKIFACFFSIAFLIMLQELSIPRPVFRFLVPGLILFSIIITLYNKWYLQQIGKYNPWILLRPILFFGSAFSLLNIIPGDVLRGLFLIIVVLLGSLFEIFLGNFAENIVLNETLVIAFGIFMSVSAYGLQYFPGFQTLWLVLLFFGIFLTTRSFYEFLPETSLGKLVSSLAIGLFCTQIFWAMTFLPFHYSASALMLFNIFYFCIILNYYYVFNTINIRKFQFHLGLLVACTVFIFLLTPWKILT
jgi:hypothetical protein